MTVDYPDWTLPQAIAASVATGKPQGLPGGVPLLHGQSVLSSVGPSVLLPGNAFTTTLTHINIGYELSVSFTASIADPNAQSSAELLFIDQASGTVVDKVAYVFWPSDITATPDQIIFAKGPTRGNQMTLRITNQAANNPLSYAYVLAQSGRPYAYDYMRPVNFPKSASTRNVPSSDTEAGILASHLVAALGAGASQVDQLPPFMGRAHIHFSSGSNAADCEITISAADDALSALSGGAVYDQFTDGTGNRDADIVLPGTQCFLTVTNHNAAAKDCRYLVAGTPY